MFSAGVLARTGSPAAIAHLVSLLDHGDINVVQQVIESLSLLRSSLAVGSLVKVLDRDPWLRFAAMHALGEIGDQRAVAALAPLLDDSAGPGRGHRRHGQDRLDRGAELPVLRAAHESPDSEIFGQCLRAIGEALEFQPNERGAPQHRRDGPAGLPASAGELHDRLNSVLAGDERGPPSGGRTP